jgi:predicted CXXCH cytochrome family protein
MHPMGTDRAHTVWTRSAFGSDKISSHAARPSTLARLDEDGSRSCISCHDGTVASDATGPSSSQVGMGFRNSGHPFGVAYSVPAGTGFRGDWNLRPAQTLNSNIRIFNGQVGCQSCHSLYSTQKNLLVMSNDSSRLCQSCHEQR